MPNNKKRGDKSFMPRSWGDASGRRPTKDTQSGQTTPQTESEVSPSSSKDSLLEALESTDSCVGSNPCDSSYSIDFSQSIESFSVGFSGSPMPTEGSEYYDDEAIECETISDGGAGGGTTWGPEDRTDAGFGARIAGIRFGYACKVYHFDAGDMDLEYGEWVLVKTEKGLGLGQVAIPPFERIIDAAQADALRKILRKGGKVDLDQRERCCQRESEAYSYCMDKIEELALAMKLVSVECFFDCSKYVFYFTSEGRVDFRELVKQLVSRFPVRIEMRQIGVRHEAKMTGGIACCGQELCCSRFLTDFRPVSVKMAKNQNLSLNPTKISGVCGRLMCCLSYEHDVYEEFSKNLPRVGKLIGTTKGEGCVIKHNPLEETVLVKLADDTMVAVRPEDILGELEVENTRRISPSNPSAPKPPRRAHSRKSQNDPAKEEI